MLITLVGVVEFNAGYVDLVHIERIKPLVDTEHAPEPLLENPKISQLSSFLHPPGPARSLHWNTTISSRKWEFFPQLEAFLLFPWKLLVPLSSGATLVTASTFPGPLEK